MPTGPTVAWHAWHEIPSSASAENMSMRGRRDDTLPKADHGGTEGRTDSVGAWQRMHHPSPPEPVTESPDRSSVHTSAPRERSAPGPFGQRASRPFCSSTTLSSAPNPVTANTSACTTVASTPATGAGTSRLTLSVSSSTTGSPMATTSPAFFIQRATRASTIDSPTSGTTICTGIDRRVLSTRACGPQHPAAPVIGAGAIVHWRRLTATGRQRAAALATWRPFRERPSFRRACGPVRQPSRQSTPPARADAGDVRDARPSLPPGLHCADARRA